MEANFVGNLVEEPRVEFTANGTAHARFRVATSKRFQNRQGEWQEKTVFVTCQSWRDVAENIAASLVKGQRIIVLGEWQQRQWETDEGQKRSVLEVVVNEAGPSLRWATADVTKTARRDGNAPSGGGSSAPSSTPAADDPFGDAATGGDEPF